MINFNTAAISQESPILSLDYAIMSHKISQCCHKLRNSSRFMGYPGRDYRQGAKTIFQEDKGAKIFQSGGEDFFTTNHSEGQKLINYIFIICWGK